VIEYVVVTRDQKLPIRRFMTIEAAGNYVRDERKFTEWTVLAQEANRITPGTAYRQLRQHEKHAYESRLYPSLYGGEDDET
jgi:hypothetical protein